MGTQEDQFLRIARVLQQAGIAGTQDPRTQVPAFLERSGIQMDPRIQEEPALVLPTKEAALLRALSQPRVAVDVGEPQVLSRVAAESPVPPPPQVELTVGEPEIYATPELAREGAMLNSLEDPQEMAALLSRRIRAEAQGLSPEDARILEALKSLQTKQAPAEGPKSTKEEE